MLSLSDVQRIAAEIAAAQSSNVEITVTRAEGDSAYTELILTIDGCADEPCQTVIGIERDAPESHLRAILATHLQEHLATHRTDTLA